MAGLIPRVQRTLALPLRDAWDWLRCKAGHDGWWCEGKPYHHGRRMLP